MAWPRIIVLMLLMPLPLLAAETPAERAARDARALLDRNARAQAPDSVVRVRPSQRIKATLVFATGGPKLNVEKWILFALGVGWIPVDISAAVEFDKTPGGLERFVNDPGDFLAFHLDPELALDVPKLGRRTVQFLQEPAVYGLGPGTFDGQIKRSEWTVQRTRPGR